MTKISMDAKLRKIDFRSNLVILIKKKNLLGTKNAL
jgi:hypothetical protein